VADTGTRREGTRGAGRGAEGDPGRGKLLGRNLWSSVDAKEDSTLYTEFHRAASDRAEVAFEADLGGGGGWFELRGVDRP